MILSQGSKSTHFLQIEEMMRKKGKKEKRKKKEEIRLHPMTKAPTPTEKSKKEAMINI